MIALLLIAQALPPVRAVQPPPESSLNAPLPALTPEAPPEGPVLALSDALEAARTQSPDLAIALERVRQAENNVQRAWSALQPRHLGHHPGTHRFAGDDILGHHGLQDPGVALS